MRGGKARFLGDLVAIHGAFPQQIFGAGDAQGDQIIDRAAVAKEAAEILQLGDADRAFARNDRKGKRPLEILLQMIRDAAKFFLSDGGSPGYRKVLALLLIQGEQKQLGQQLQPLQVRSLGAGSQAHSAVSGIRKAGFGNIHDRPQQVLLLLGQREEAVIKGAHDIGGTLKAQNAHHRVHRGRAVTRVKGIGREKDDAARRDGMALTVQNDIIKAAFDIHQLIKIMQLPAPLIVGEVEVVHTVKSLNRKDIFRMDHLKFRHRLTPFRKTAPIVQKMCQIRYIHEEKQVL